MPHLSPERIAALVDEPVTDGEREHLEQCARCRADFVAVRRIVSAAAAERDQPIAPLVPWQQIATALRAEGVLAGDAWASRPPVPSSSSVPSSSVRAIESAPSVVALRHEAPVAVLATRTRSPRWARMAGLAAAAALLVTFGMAGGRMMAPVGAGDGAMAVGQADALPSVAPVQRVAPVVSTMAVTQFRTPEDARATLRAAEEVYSGALLWLAAHDSALAPRQSGGSAAAAMTYRQRLEVLDASMATARRALSEAPDDPVMNRYYLATLGAREVTLRRLTTVLPASQQVLEY